MPLITLADAKLQLNIPADNTSKDEELQTFVAASARAVERARGEVIEQRAITEPKTLRASRAFLLNQVPVVSLTSVTGADGTTWDTAVLRVDASGLVTVVSGPPVDGSVTVVYQAGYADSAITADYQLAARIILQHLWQTQRGAQGTVPGTVVGADEAYDPRYSYAIPRRALELLGAPLPGVA